LQAARISYVENKDYEKAYNYYRQLSTDADFKATETESYKGMMYSAYYLNRYNDAAAAAKRILVLEKAKNEDLVEAHFYLAKIAYAQNDLTVAFSEFSLLQRKSLQ
jgi:hypothetical protein